MNDCRTSKIRTDEIIDRHWSFLTFSFFSHSLFIIKKTFCLIMFIEFFFYLFPSERQYLWNEYILKSIFGHLRVSLILSVCIHRFCRCPISCILLEKKRKELSRLLWNEKPFEWKLDNACLSKILFLPKFSSNIFQLIWSKWHSFHFSIILFQSASIVFWNSLKIGLLIRESTWRWGKNSRSL